MTKKELANYAGIRFYNLSRRMGGQYRDINCLTVYEVTERGTCKYIYEAMSCVANKAQISYMKELTGSIYHVGGPCADNLTVEFLEKNR